MRDAVSPTPTDHTPCSLRSQTPLSRGDAHVRVPSFVNDAGREVAGGHSGARTPPECKTGGRCARSVSRAWWRENHLQTLRVGATVFADIRGSHLHLDHSRWVESGRNARWLQPHADGPHPQFAYGSLTPLSRGDEAAALPRANHTWRSRIVEAVENSPIIKTWRSFESIGPKNREKGRKTDIGKRADKPHMCLRRPEILANRPIAAVARSSESLAQYHPTALRKRRFQMRDCARSGIVLAILAIAGTAFARGRDGTETKTENRVERKEIPNAVEYIFSRLVRPGRLVKAQAGKPGQVIRTYRVTLSQGKVVSKDLVKVERIEPTTTRFLMAPSGMAPDRHMFSRSRVLEHGRDGVSAESASSMESHEESHGVGTARAVRLRRGRPPGRSHGL